MPSASRGVYVLSNDRYFEWTVALTESVRAWNPALPIRLLPFDDRCDRVVALAQRYGFSIEDPASLVWLDDVGRRLGPPAGAAGLPVGTYRRFACFWGPFEQFVFLDSDVVVTCDLDRVLDALDHTGAGIAYMHAAPLDMVYADPSRLPGASRAPRFGMSGGVWASRLGVLTPESFRRLADELEPHRAQLLNSDQAVLSYLVDSTSLPATSFDAVDLGYPHGWVWAGDRWDGVGFSLARRDGLPVLRAPSSEVAMVHWAGCALTTTMAHRALWREYRWFGPGHRVRRAVDRGAGGARAAAGRVLHRLLPGSAERSRRR